MLTLLFCLSEFQESLKIRSSFLFLPLVSLSIFSAVFYLSFVLSFRLLSFSSSLQITHYLHLSINYSFSIFMLLYLYYFFQLCCYILFKNMLYICRSLSFSPSEGSPFFSLLSAHCFLFPFFAIFSSPDVYFFLFFYLFYPIYSLLSVLFLSFSLSIF